MKMKNTLFLIIVSLLLTLKGNAQNDSSPLKSPALQRYSIKMMGEAATSNFLVDSFLFNDVHFHYIQLNDPNSLNSVINSFSEENYPFTLVRKNTFDKMRQMLLLYDEQFGNAEKFQAYTQQLEQLYQMELSNLQLIGDLQEKRASNYKVLSESLYTDAQNMSELLNESLDATKKAIRGKTVKNIWTGVIGGAVGFLIAAVILD